MELYQFNFLSNVEQIETIKSLAVYLGEHNEDNYIFKVYQIDEFYIKEKWHRVFNERRTLTAFTSIDELKLYLK